jgi:hypothetical protein
VIRIDFGTVKSSERALLINAYLLLTRVISSTSVGNIEQPCTANADLIYQKTNEN